MDNPELVGGNRSVLPVTPTAGGATPLAPEIMFKRGLTALASRCGVGRGPAVSESGALWDEIRPPGCLLATRPLRRMRGGTQAFLLQTEDGTHYVVKFTNNPQHRRILVNDLVCTTLLRHLEIAAPTPAVIGVTQDFLDEHPEVSIQLQHGSVPVEPGLHFGSMFPGDPDRVTVFDFLPEAVLPKLFNASDFLGVLVFDKWVGNTDCRQSILFRGHSNRWLPCAPQPRGANGLIALMIDNGFAFDGPAWAYRDSPIQGLCHQRGVYRGVQTLRDFDPWVERIDGLSESVFSEVRACVPRSWLVGDESHFDRLLETLSRRRSRLPDLLASCLDVLNHQKATLPSPEVPVGVYDC